ncbi:MAG: transcriptional repressor [Clostridia bacterium]|nr:transcriptional repressor [Clostridia bacterium]
MEYKTDNKNRILEFLKSNEDRALSVSDINEHLEKDGHKVNQTTIYRFLDKLEDQGKLIKFSASENGGKAKYQLAKLDEDCHEHLHLQCKICGKVEHFDCSFMDEIQDHIMKDHGFTMNCMDSIIYGTCRECMRKAKKL